MTTFVDDEDELDLDLCDCGHYREDHPMETGCIVCACEDFEEGP